MATHATLRPGNSRPGEACNIAASLPHTALVNPPDVWLVSPLRTLPHEDSCPATLDEEHSLCSRSTPIGKLCYYVATSCLSTSDMDECCVR